MNTILQTFGQGWTPGAIGIWTLVGAVLLGWWRGLPAVLDAFERKQSGIELRTEALLDAQGKRFAEQLAAADDRHEECMEGQRKLREEMDILRRDNDELRGLIAAIRQGEKSVANVVARTIQDAHNDGLNAPATLRSMARRTGDRV